MDNEDGPAHPELAEDALVSALVPDPAQLPDVLCIVGLLGRSDRAGAWRLYLTADLTHYIEVDEADVLHARPVGSPEDAFGGQAVWVKRTAKLQHSVATTSLRAQTEFLRGDVGTAFTAGSARAHRVAAGGVPLIDSGGGLAADPTLFRANTCALSSCVSDVAICTNSGQRTCDPVFCVAAPVAFR
jgi:hypothetical protein